MRRPAQFDRPLTVIEVGGLLVALALILATCLGMCVAGMFAPSPPPQVPDPVRTVTFEKES